MASLEEGSNETQSLLYHQTGRKSRAAKIAITLIIVVGLISVIAVIARIFESNGNLC
jgi:hypothetical protein